jgi:superfamily II DNA helicase RecQ
LKLKAFTLRFSETAGGFDDELLQEFIVDKEVIEYSEHFFVHERTPYLTVLLAYRGASEDKRRRPGPGPDFRQEMDDVEKEAFDGLKAWRMARARLEGIPPYMIASNKQLAKMITMRVGSRSALSSIEGIGEAKSAKYGEEILLVLGKHLAPHGVALPEAEKEPKT